MHSFTWMWKWRLFCYSVCFSGLKHGPDGVSLNTTLEILTAVLLENNKPKLENISIQNPVTDYITIYSPQNIDNATVQIIDMLGKEIITKTNQTIDENYQIQTNLNKGIYLIRIFDQEKSITKKVIKH